MTVAVTISNAQGQQYANAYDKGDRNAGIKLLKTLVQQDNNLQSCLNQASEARMGVITPTGNSGIIALGFKPKYVKVMNVTDAKTLEYSSNMSTGCALLTVGGANGSLGSFLQYVQSEGVTVSATGFSVGSNIIATGKVVMYLALRQGP